MTKFVSETVTIKTIRNSVRTNPRCIENKFVGYEVSIKYAGYKTSWFFTSKKDLRETLKKGCGL